jgi:hypothetical protein
LVGNSVIPSHDPLGNEIIISPTEINTLKAVGAYYEAIAKNIDANNDSIPDVLSNMELMVYSLFARFSGHWGHNDTVPALTDSSHTFINYSIEIDGGSAQTFSGGNIVLSGPAGSPYSDITTWGYMMAPQCGSNWGFISSFNRQAVAPADAPWGTSFLPFMQGEYTLTLDGSRQFTLNYSNIDAKYNLVIVSPTLHTDSQGKLTSITLDYTLPDGTTVNPGSLMSNCSVTFSDSTANQFYNSPQLTISTGFTTINFSTPMDISPLRQIDIGYLDLLGNTYDIIWR